MTRRHRRGRDFFANPLHREIFFLVSFASILPALIIAVALFYLIFNITADAVGIPESIVYNIIPAAKRVVLIVSLAAPLVIAVILAAVHKVTHQIVGPFDRIIRELDECLQGSKKDRILLRKNDKFWPLVNRINDLLDKLREK